MELVGVFENGLPALRLGRQPRVEAGLRRRLWSTGSRPRPAAPQEGLDCQTNVQKRAERHQRGAGFAGGVVFVVAIVAQLKTARAWLRLASLLARFAANVRLAFKTIAGGAGQRQYGASDRAQPNQRQDEAIAAQGVTRDRQNCVADDAAEPRRQRPAVGDRQQ